jgi:GTPase SAR1 family protein
MRRPYVIPDLQRALGADWPRDPSAELSRIFGFVQDVVLRPLNDRLPGRPFEYDFQSFPFTPTVLVIGNHSSGKSTFINSLLGKGVQETGIAPTDDCFTVLERHQVDQQEDGPTVMGCPENRPFAELRKFGQIFSGHLRRKRVVLPDDSLMPFGLQIVDTPGMIDLPASDSSFRGRGYNFVDVARWWAKRSDLVLLLFDPDKPGTTGETLEVLTESLQGLDHKLMIVLNKVDKLDNSADFARAYGALGWALSKVIK